jgi:hypothetical protein
MSEILPHLLTKTESSHVPRRLMFMDCESEVQGPVDMLNQEEHQLRCGAARFFKLSDGEVVYDMRATFMKGTDFLDWMASYCSSREMLYVFVHGAAWDLTLVNLWEELTPRSWYLESYVIEDPPTILTIRTPGGMIRVIDVLNYWRVPIAELAASVDVSLPVVPEGRYGLHTAMELCACHCEVIEKAIMGLLGLIRTNDLGCFTATAASLSMSIYRHRFMDHQIHIHKNPEVSRLERDAYFGGLADVHFLGEVEGPVYKLDTNSLYPWVMHEYALPSRLLCHGGEVDVQSIELKVAHRAYIARVRLRTADAVYPRRKDHRVEYATGQFDTVLAGPELSEALLAGRVQRVYEYAQYDREHLFQSFVEYFYDLKLKAARAGDAATVALVKMLLNSLHGKFGQRGNTWVDLVEPSPPLDFGSWWSITPADPNPVRCRAVAGFCQRLEENEESRNSFTAISAFITSYARVHMRHVISLTRWREVFYEDADSIHVSGAGYLRLYNRGFIHPTALGKLRVVSIAKRAVYHGVRDYELDGEKVISGIKIASEPISDHTYLQQTKQGLPAILDREPDGKVRLRRQVMTLRRDHYLNRERDGGWLRPLVLDE